MKPFKEPLVKDEKVSQRASSVDKSRSGRIRINLVSEKERDMYRVPTYGYILP